MNCKNLHEGAQSSFWKMSSNLVPGNPRKQSTIKKSKSINSSFVIYEKSVLDAWDVIEDTLETKKSVVNLLRPHGDVSANTAKFENLKKIGAFPEGSFREESCREDSFREDSFREDSFREDSFHEDSFRKDSFRGDSLSGHSRREDSLCKGAFPVEARHDPQLRLRALFRKCTNLEQLRKLGWNGVPHEMRPTIWKLLSGYIPFDVVKRENVLGRKRKEYWSFVGDNFENRYSRDHKDTFHQIHIDVPRMNPFMPIFQQKVIQEMFERVLFLWALSHPASGYVQGINDLVTPFFLVFLQQYIPIGKSYCDFSVESLCKEEFEALEADVYWCLTSFMAGIQDNYIFAQTGIQKNINKMRDLVQRLDVPLHEHLLRNEVDFVQFAFRWFNNLLTRELTVSCIVRLWDTYLAEGDCFPLFLPYVCTAFLLHWRDKLLELTDFQGLMMLLQNLPTKNWDDFHISLIVADAYRLKVMFADSPKHLEKY